MPVDPHDLTALADLAEPSHLADRAASSRRAEPPALAGQPSPFADTEVLTRPSSGPRAASVPRRQLGDSALALSGTLLAAGRRLADSARGPSGTVSTARNRVAEAARAASGSEPTARRRVAGLACASVAAGLVAGLVVPTAQAGVVTAATHVTPATGAAASAGLLSGAEASLFARPTGPAAPTSRTSGTATKAATPGAAATGHAAGAATTSPTSARSTSTKAATAGAATTAPTGARTATPPTGATTTVARRLAAPNRGAGAPGALVARPSRPGAWAVTKPLPSDSGVGRRIVYAERAAHLWVVDADGTVLRDYKVTGRIGRPRPGLYHVFSKSPSAVNPGEKLTFDLMVRFAHGVTGAPIGFHTIPRYYDGHPMQLESDLGRAIGRGGCVRQSRADATWLYRWSRVHDTVVVLA